MNRIGTYLGSISRTTRAILLGLAVIFISAGVAQAATTISTSILTNGTLGATGVSTFGGSASTTISVAGVLTTPSAVVNGTLGVIGISTFGATASTTISAAGVLTTPASARAIFLGGASTTQLTLLSGDTIKNASASTTAVSGTLTADANFTLLNAQAATSTATVACIVSTATSSATKIRLMYNTQATTTSINGNTVQGVVLWGYGTSCAN